ncbi:MAG TPA: serine hydrolase domain-containing protein [Steroidobacteraceae bacterium]|nr:serine hydrolase domain-containing protein [Steroidobacteraceae bacterium]
MKIAWSAAPAVSACLLLGLSIDAPAGAPETPVARATLQAAIDEKRLAGAVVLIEDREKILDFEAIGFSNLASRSPMRKDALFWIASTSKPFVATAVMMLVEEGRLDLDAPVTTWLPGFTPVLVPPQGQPGTPTHPSITLRQLLSHTSGLPGGSPEETPTLDGTPLAERVTGYGKLTLFFEPGAGFSYGNADVNTAAYIVEKVSGMPYEVFLRQRVLDPLGMKDTTFCPSATQLKRLATSYIAGQDGRTLIETPLLHLRYPLDDCAHRYPIPAGGLFSTASDLARFARMFLNGGALEGRRYVSAASVDTMTHNVVPEAARRGIPQSAPPANVGYGLGWGASLNGDYFHPGTAMTDIRIDPTRRIATVLLFQLSTDDSFMLRDALLKASDARYAIHH